MHKLLFIFFLIFVCIGCNNTSSKEDTNSTSSKEDTNKDSIIKLQEERINQLQQQLNNTSVTTVDTNSTTPENNKQIDLSSSLNYFTIGSTEDEVLAVQGQPTSIEKILDSKIFFYGGSSVTFNKGIVESYRDDGSLKIKVGTNSKKINPSNNNDNSENVTSEKSNENKQVKYIYFTFMTTDVQIDIDPITKKLKNKDDDYSKIYSISGYTYQKEQALEFCLTKNYKEWFGKQVFLTAHSYDDKQLALMNWNSEKGSLYNHAMCSELMQIGIIAQ